MENLKQKYDIVRMVLVVTDRLNDFDDNCEESEYGKDYRQQLINTIELLKEIEKN